MKIKIKINKQKKIKINKNKNHKGFFRCHQVIKVIKFLKVEGRGSRVVYNLWATIIIFFF
jgi:hypothetical protein